MLRNYFKIAIRNLRAKKAFSFINITGLAVGMAGAILILLWVQNEYSFDSFHANNKTLYKVWYRFVAKDYTGTQDVTAGPLGNALAQEYPEIKSSSRVYWSTNRLFNYRDRSLKAKGNDVDKAFLTMFTFPLIEGNAAHALEDVNSVVLTQHLAKKIFGESDPMNQLVKIDNKQVYKVTGIMADLPNNTEFDFEYLVPLPANGAMGNDNSWNSNSYYTYVQLQPNVNIGQVNQKIKSIAFKHDPKNNPNTEVFLYPFSKMHLYGKFENGKVAGGRIEIVRLLLGIAGIILLIACINFMNLSTAQSQKRAKEVGVRKVMGAMRASLVGQFLTESLAITAIAGAIALFIAQLCLPAFNGLTSKDLFINYADPYYWMVFLCFILFTGVLAGSYPAFFLSGFRPVKVLKGRFSAAKMVLNPRKVLVVLQFSVAIVLVISTIVIYRQIKFAQNKDIGYHIDHLAEVPIEGDIRKNFEPIKNDLLASGAATAMCETSITVTVDGSTSSGYSLDGANKDQQNIEFSRFGTSGDFIKTMGLTLIGGRDIDFNAYPSDSVSCLLNETAVKQLGMKNAVGGFIKSGNFPLKVVGVFKDFIINSPYVDNRPMIVYASKTWAFNTLIRFNGQNSMSKDIALAEKVFKKYNPSYPFNYQFVDQEYRQKFNDQQQTGKLSAIFAGLTILISCLGLFGLASYMAENRAKEIGIRKVLGASVAGITQMLTKEFVSLVIIAIAIAIPVSWWAMNKWLQDFTYRIHIGWLTFALAGLSAIVIAVLTVSFQSIKAALANPADIIKAE
ncbi:MAG: ABC transporter permease [Sphingobacteriales bacterium]